MEVSRATAKAEWEPVVVAVVSYVILYGEVMSSLPSLVLSR